MRNRMTMVAGLCLLFGGSLAAQQVSPQAVDVAPNIRQHTAADLQSAPAQAGQQAAPTATLRSTAAAELGLSPSVQGNNPDTQGEVKKTTEASLPEEDQD